MKRSMLLAVFIALMACAVPRAEAASDYLLELDGIKGESADARHPGSIELDSFSWGINIGSVTGGGGAGKATFKEFTLTKRIDKSSPLLFKACASGQHIKEAVLHVRKSGGDQQDYYVIKLTDILISSVQQGPGSDAADGRPMESFSLNFTKIEWTYRAGDGSVTQASWNQATNAPD